MLSSKKKIPAYLPKLKLMGRSTANKYIFKDGLTESRIPLNMVLRGVRIVALSISSHEQTKSNRVCCFLIL